jgi:hypothetical protein
MKLLNPLRSTVAAFAAAAACLLALPSAPPVLAQTPSPDSPAPRISGIRSVHTNLVVTVQVPAGVRRITLESRPRLGGGTWKPRAVLNPTNDPGEVSLSIPAVESTEILRVVTDDALSLGVPAGFFQGTDKVAPQVSPTQPSSTGAGGAPVPEVSAPGQNLADRTSVAATTVEESDIWKFAGNHLYFFNQQRGLQVIDVTRPDSPVLRGLLPMIARGEQLYVLPTKDPAGDWLALLTQPECRWDATEVVLVQSAATGPRQSGSVLLPGYPIESRLVGNVLVVASQGWTNRPVSASEPQGATVFESLTWVSAVDLADPAKPAIRSLVESKSVAQAIHATDRHLFVATMLDSGGTVDPANPKEYLPPTYRVNVFDITDPSGNIRPAGGFNTAGRVADKFKFGVSGDVVTVVSQIDARWRSSGVVEPSVVTLETFTLQDPLKPVRLARLNLITNESVFATRYDGDRAYVVTFRRVDPLWIVDLSDPAKPVIRGELEVPGWSTYIEPMGDRLIAMGVEEGRAAVSLFDVSKAEAPRLAAKVFLGDGWSWSEANADEKAFKVFPDAGLVLLPWHGRQGTNGWFQGVQLLEFTRESLKLRGTIDHSSAARRAVLREEHVLSLSGGELVSASVADRDRPQVRAVLGLSQTVDQVFETGDRLVQLSNGTWDMALQAQGAPRLRLSPSSDPDATLASLTLTNLPVVGADLRDGFLYLLHRGPDTSKVENPGTTNEVWSTLPGETLMQVIAVTRDRLEVVGRSQPSKVSAAGWGRYAAHWPHPGSLVWAPESGSFWPIWMRGAAMIGGDALIAPGRGIWFGWGNTRWLAVDVSRRESPAFVGEYAVGDGGSVSTLVVRGGKVFASVARYQWVPASTNKPPANNALPWWDTQGSWVTDHTLRVLDAADPSEPVLRDPVPLPGQLQGVSHGGSVLHCRVETSDAKGLTSVTLQSLGYDGVAARRIAQRELPDLGAHPLTVLPDGRIAVTVDKGAALETWALDASGSLVTVTPAFKLGAALTQFFAFDGLLLGEGDGSLVLVGADPAGALRVFARGDRPCSLWLTRANLTTPTTSGVWVARGASGAWWLPFTAP